MGASRRLAHERVRFRRHYGVLCSIATKDAASQDADCRSVRVTISGTGHMADRRSYRISRSCVGDTIERFTKRAFRSSDRRTVSCASDARTDSRSPTYRRPMAVPANATDTLQAHNNGAGMQIDARTTTPGWQGERLDVGYAISVLHPLATGS